MNRKPFLWIVFRAILLGPMFLAACARRNGAAGINRSPGGAASQGMMGMMKPGPGGMMGNTTRADMNVCMDMFSHHTEITRSVQEIPNGIRTVTESYNPRITALLQTHVSRMYEQVAIGQEVRCMSASLPTMFRNATRYQRQLTLTPRGVAIEETSSDQDLVRTIRLHAREVSGFVTDGMPAMMRSA